MTKAEMMRMVANMEDNEEVMFVEQYTDKDGFPAERTREIIAIVPKGTEKVNTGYYIMRYKREGVEEKK